MHLVYPLAVASVLFGIGVYGVLARRNAVLVLMAVELLLNAANLDFVAFDAYWRDTVLHSGQVYALFVVVIAAAELGVGLAIVLTIFRQRRHIAIDEVDSLREREVPR